MKRVETRAVRPKTRRALRALAGRRVVIEGFGPLSPAFVAITGGTGSGPCGAWLSPHQLRQLIETAKKILK
jgi:hypothetical protein